MKVKRIIDGLEFNTEKNADGTYDVDGANYLPEAMKELFSIVKTVAKKAEPTITSQEDTMSDDIAELATALAKANGAMVNGKKDKEGYGYSYMTLNGLVDIARPILAKNGLSLMQTHNSTSKTVTTNTLLLHSSGQWIRTSLEIGIVASKQLSIPQQVGVICTYARRYAIQAMFMIAADEDTDGK